MSRPLAHTQRPRFGYRLPLAHHKHLKSTNLVERLNEEFKRRTRIVRIFPNEASCLRLIRALAVEMHENWLEAPRYPNMDYWREHKKEQLRASPLRGLPQAARLWTTRKPMPAKIASISTKKKRKPKAK